jgi:Beta-ketoacyl synthase, C-terminal domain
MFFDAVLVHDKVMESLEHAMKRDAPIIAEYLGGAVNCDAYHMTDPRADGFGVSSCIKQSLQDAGVAPEEVAFSPFSFHKCFNYSFSFLRINVHFSIYFSGELHKCTCNVHSSW